MTPKERAELIIGMAKQAKDRAAFTFTYDDWIIYATQQIETAEMEAKNRGVEEERKRCADHAESIARTSALLPSDDPDRDGPCVARRIEKLILG